MQPTVLTVVGRRRWGQLRRGFVRIARQRWVRHLFWGSTLAVAVAMIVAVGLWWRLAQGPIEFDVATPWLKQAIQDNFGGQHTVTVGGTQIERDEQGRTSLRLRDIVVRDADGTVVASAPKAEVGISGVALLRGQVRAQSLNLVGAEMAVRIERDGSVTVFAGANKRPIATAAPSPALTPAPAGKPAPATNAPAAAPEAAVSGFKDLAGVLAWLDGLGATGLDGHDLRELGLKDGNLIVDDRRNGKRWTFDHINASLRRPAQGGVVFRLQSDNPQRPWLLSAAMRPLPGGEHAVGIEARQVSIRDILLALRINEKEWDADLPLSASIRADIAADGTPQTAQGQLLAGAGTVIEHQGDDTVRLDVERADVRFNWSAQRHSLVMPFQVQVGGNQFTLRAILEAPTDNSGVWHFEVTRGDAVIDPVILGPAARGGESLALNRVSLHGRIDTVHKRIDLEQGDASRSDPRPLYNVGLAFSGSFDYSGVPHLAFGVAGTRMPTSILKRLWPMMIAVDVRDWVESHVSDGMIERVVVAGNAPLADFKTGGPPTPDDGLSVDIETSGTTLQPVPDLPAIRDADLAVRITGRTATVNLGRGTVDVAQGRRLNVANGLFEIADTYLKPAPAQVHFRVDGSVPAAALLLQRKTLRDEIDFALDPESSRGTVAAQVSLALPIGRKPPPGSVTYDVKADLSSFAADKMLMGEKLESPLLQVDASSKGYQIKGDVKINGLPATLHLTKRKTDADAQLLLQAKLDEATRRRLGVDLGGAVAGTIPIEFSGRFASLDKDVKLTVNADLTPVTIDNLLPGWEKPAGKPAHLTATLIKGAKSLRFDDLALSGSGSNVKGSLEVDNSGDLVSAHFPVFALSDGDQASLKVERGSDGVMRVTMRGSVYDGRNFIKVALAGGAPQKHSKHKPIDLDLDVKIGTVLGHNGETLRGLSLIDSRRNGRVRTFSLSAKIGRDAPLIGDLRLRARDNHQVVYIETGDAGALFRFTDMYPRMYGGKMWVAMDPPGKDQAAQIGHLYISNFTVRNEPALERVVAGGPGQAGNSVEFTELRADFTRTPGHMSIRDGVVRGPLVGVTIEGNIDYVKNDVHLRGTFVPFYGLNNMFGQIPIVGLFLGGGSNEGLVGITYEAVGPPSAPRIRVNPVSAIAPGLLRKFIPSPGALDPQFQPLPR